MAPPHLELSSRRRGMASREMAAVARTVALVGLAGMVLLAAPGVDARDKIDVIMLRTGDRITGEINNLGLGILTVNTDHIGTVSVEWVAVASIESKQLFEVFDVDGRQVVGTIDPGSVSGELAITGPEGGTAIVQCDRIARINQLGRTHWQRWRGNVSLGASLTSANNQRDLSLDASTTYQTKHFRLRNTLSGAISDRDDATRTSWGTFVTNYQRQLSGRWFWYSQLQFDRNEELDLELRSTISGGGGRYLLMNDRSQLFASVGVSALKEVYAPANEGDWSTELALSGDYELFLFQGRETSLTSSLSWLPSLSVSGRYRVEYAVSFNRKLVRDFTVSLNLSGNYDSMPPEGSKASDTSFRISMGWSR